MISIVRHGIAESLKEKKQPSNVEENGMDVDTFEDEDENGLDENEEEKSSSDGMDIPRIPCILSTFLVR